MSIAPWLEASGEAMWALVDRYTGNVRYKGGAKESASLFYDNKRDDDDGRSIEHRLNRCRVVVRVRIDPWFALSVAKQGHQA